MESRGNCAICMAPTDREAIDAGGLTITTERCELGHETVNIEMPPRAVRRLGRLPMQQRVWRAMRIFGRFTVPDLLRVTRGTKARAVRAWLRNLEGHGIVRQVGTAAPVGMPGSHYIYTIVIADRPEPPAFCGHCGRSIGERGCR